MSVTGAVNLLVEDSVFELTGGTAPMCECHSRSCVPFSCYHRPTCLRLLASSLTQPTLSPHL